MKAFFQKYLDNKASEEDFRSFVSLFADPKKQAELEENMKEDWGKMQRDVDVPDLSAGLHKIHFEINKQEQAQPKPTRFLTYLTRVAAVLLIPLAVAFFLQLQKNSHQPAQMQTVSTPLASKTSFTLPDGSTVWLNSGSSIQFPSEFDKDQRLVSLSGEAYFDVKKAEKPFRVETAHFTVDVLGTAFNIMAYDGEIPAITLDRGKVLLQTETTKQLAMAPGQQAVVDTVSHKVALREVENGLFSSWVNNQLIIKNEPLETVVRKLERWYNIDIDVTDRGLMAVKMTANIEFESVREVMELMELTLPVKYEYRKNDRRLIVSKK